MHCAAPPIRNIYGNLAGVLDMSSEGIDFNLDAISVVSLYASSIENRLPISHLIAQSHGLQLTRCGGLRRPSLG